MIHLRPQPTEATAAPKPLTTFGWGLGHHLDYFSESKVIDSASVARLRNAGVTRHRLNVRWNRIILDRGDIDLMAVERLSDSIDFLLDADIEPLVALDNVAVPEFLAADGGWLNLATARAYGNFAGVLGARLGDRVDEWLTMASPAFAPQDPSVWDALSIAQAESHRILRAHCPGGSIGSSIDIGQFDVSAAAPQVDAGRAWVDHLIQAGNSPDFVSVNISLPGGSTPTFVSEVIRMLATRCPHWSFVLTEINDRNSTDHLAIDPTRSEAHRLAVAALMDHVRVLRADQIDVRGTFTRSPAMGEVDSPSEFVIDVSAPAG